MRFEVFLQSAAIKILRQKLSQVSFSAGFPFRFKMAQVFFSSVFYLVLLTALAICAFLVRLIGTTTEPEPQPETRTPPKQGKLPPPKNTSQNNGLKDEVDQQQDLPKSPESESGQKAVENSYKTSTKLKTATKPRRALMLESPLSTTIKTTAGSSALSLLTTVLLRDGKRLKSHSSEKVAHDKLGRSHLKLKKND